MFTDQRPAAPDLYDYMVLLLLVFILLCIAKERVLLERLTLCFNGKIKHRKAF